MTQGWNLKSGTDSYQYKHGHCVREKSPTYHCWARMIQRCTNKNHTRYPEYGGRGIKLCERWLTFSNFLLDVGEKPDGKSLDRFPDNNGDYRPGNVRWASAKEQQNNRRSSVLVTIKGVSKTISEWSDYSGVPYATLWYRLNSGWNPSEAIV